jgi:nitrogen fixation NifU-like protein
MKLSRMVRQYSKRVIDHFENPRNIGSFGPNGSVGSAVNIGTAIVGAPACGDVMKLQIKVDDNGIIIDTRFKTFGCGSAIASSSYLSEAIKGKHIKHINISNVDIAAHLKLPPVKLHCSILAEDALTSAIKDLARPIGHMGLPPIETT